MKPETWVALYVAIIGTSAFLLNLKAWFDSGVKLKSTLVGAAVLVLLAVAAPALAFFPRRGKLSRDHVAHVERLTRAGQDPVHGRRHRDGATAGVDPTGLDLEYRLGRSADRVKRPCNAKQFSAAAALGKWGTPLLFVPPLPGLVASPAVPADGAPRLVGLVEDR
jgi:hypothetical protein